MAKPFPITETIDKTMFVMMENMAEAAIESVNSNLIMPMPLQTILVLEKLEFAAIFVVFLKRLL